MNKLTYFIVGFIFLVSKTQGQVFHFLDTTTTLIKTTDQSPAHWYLEIYNDTNLDYTLRWKAIFLNIPIEWDINFDTQSALYDPVLDGDSADFILMDSLVFPQKLIIGATTNNTPGHGSVFFDIYDPANPSNLVTIEYEFIITGVPAGIEELTHENLIGVIFGYIEFFCSKPCTYSIISQSGQLVRTGNTQNGNCNISDLTSGIYFVYLQVGEKNYTQKFWR